ncbi:MAG: hypothetical protein IPJ19_02470 [Planctomycetes bacterium]|nr:hypothetical protein [Planctomycetota bacterium]
MLALPAACLEATGLVVIAPAGWEAALAPFVAARAAERPCVFLALEDVLARNRGHDAPERIKHELYRRWKEEHLGYALLVGDADTFPVRFMVLDRCTEPAFHYAFYPSDHYYADLARADGSFDDWNAEQQGFHAGYFGEVRGECHKEEPINFDRISYLPEIAVGRWPVSSATEAQAVAAKTLAWKPLGEHPRALLVHAPEWIDARAQAGALADAWKDSGFEVRRQLYAGEGEPPTPRSVEEALLAGVDLAVHLGHGSEETWYRCLGPAQRDALAAAHPAVFLSIGCSTAHLCNEPPYQPYLDETGIAHRGTNAGEVFPTPPPPPSCYQPGALNSTGLGERLLRMPSGGAVVYIGCGTGAQPCALTLLEGFGRALTDDPAQCVGDAWKQALAFYFEHERLAQLTPDAGWYPPSIFFQGMKFLCYGDPTLRLR